MSLLILCGGIMGTQHLENQVEADAEQSSSFVGVCDCRLSWKGPFYIGLNSGTSNRYQSLK